MVDYCVFTGKIAYSKSGEHGNVPVSYEIYRAWLDSGKKDIYEVARTYQSGSVQTTQNQTSTAQNQTSTQPNTGGTT